MEIMLRPVLAAILLTLFAAPRAHALMLFPPFGPTYDAKVSTVIPISFSEAFYPGLSHSFAVPGFDASLGTLVGASIIIDGTESADLHFRSPNGVYPSSISVTVNTSIQGPGAWNSSSGSGATAVLTSAGTYHVNESSNGSGVFVFNSTDLSAIKSGVPAGTFGIDAGVSQPQFCCQTYNGDAISFTGAVTVSYYYDQASPIPEPASLVILGMGLLGTAYLRRYPRSV